MTNDNLSFSNDINHQIDQIEKGVLLILKTADKIVINKRLKPSKWSVAEHISHIEIVNRLYINKIEDTLSISSSSDEKFTSSLIGKWFAKLMEPPVRVRLKTFKPMNPQKVLDVDQLREQFVETNKKLIELAERACSENKLNLKMSSPVTDLIKLKLGDAFNVVTAHARRHVWLVEEILNKDV